jgi:transmembrane sensor
LVGKNTLTTDVGEQRSYQLEDGSLVHLNTQSRVKVRYSESSRSIQLLAGEVLFDVAHDSARPFRVTAGPATIQAVGTQFNVYRGPEQVNVAVVEGRVQIEPSEPQDGAGARFNPGQGHRARESAKALLNAGEEAAVEGNGRVVKSTTADIPAAVAWRQHRLVFRSERLDHIAAQFNRYNRTKIEIEGEGLAAQRASGTFNANEPNAFIHFLQEDSSVDIARTVDSILVRAR